MASQFKRDYDKGTVIIGGSGREINVLDLPQDSLKYFAVYGFIRACQDPTGGEKDEDKRFKMQAEIAQALISGTHEKKSRTFGLGLEDKLDEANANLQKFVSADDAMKRFLAGIGISKSSMEAEIKKIETAIKRRDEKKAAPTKAAKAVIPETEGEISAAIATASEEYEEDAADDVEVNVVEEIV